MGGNAQTFNKLKVSGGNFVFADAGGDAMAGEFFNVRNDTQVRLPVPGFADRDRNRVCGMSFGVGSQSQKFGF